MTIDNVNHNLVHTLSVRLDASWHDQSYEHEASCTGCQHVFDRLRVMDEEAVNLLSNELASHVKDSKFPVNLAT
jgi:tRNA U54 and U55 pseudouridine synthase Pus10